MAMRSAVAHLFRRSTAPASRNARCLSDSKGRALNEEEKAVENIYIQKMEREKLEKMKQKAEKEKAEVDKNKTQKKSE